MDQAWQYATTFSRRKAATTAATAPITIRLRTEIT
jgi:hypothetical protein